MLRRRRLTRRIAARWATLLIVMLVVGLMVFGIYQHQHKSLAASMAQRCPGIPAIPATEPRDLYYNSVLGLLVLTWNLSEGVELTAYYEVLDLAHEESADYSIKIRPYPDGIQVTDHKKVVAAWWNTGNKGACEDYQRR